MGTEVIKLNRSESKLAAFVQRAVSNDAARPILTGMSINDDLVSGADGFRLHAVASDRLPPFAESNGKVIDLGKIRAGENLLEPTEIEGSFPDVTQLVPNGDKEPIVRFAVDPAFLVDAVKTLDKGKPVCITVYSDLQPIEIQGVIDEIPVYALLMPMHLEGHECPDLSWKPRTGEAQVIE